MALSHADHKRIALTIASEIKKVLSVHNGERLQKKHQARVAPPKPEGVPGHEGSEGMDEMIAEMDTEPAEGAPADLSEEKRPPFKKGKFPPRRG